MADCLMLNSKLEEEIWECSLCLEDFQPGQKVFQCRDGHIVCEKCYPADNICKTCKQFMPGKKIRNTVLEYMVGKKYKSPTNSKTDITDRKILQPIRRTENRHMGVCCDGPDCKREDFCGPRFKCLECKDYDLCTACQRSGVHPFHTFICIPHPSQTEKAMEQWNKCQAKEAVPAPDVEVVKADLADIADHDQGRGEKGDSKPGDSKRGGGGSSCPIS